MQPVRPGLILVLSLSLFLAAPRLAPAAAPAAPAGTKKAPVAVAFPAATATPAPEVAISPYLQNPAPDAISILWRTAQPAYGWIEYGETPALGQKQDRVIDGMREANTLDHHVRLSGLKPGKTYYYRAASRIITRYGGYKTDFGETQYSSTTQFTLPAPATNRITCCILNDLHNNLPLFETLAAQIRRAAPDVVFFNGDCLADPQNPNAVLRVFQTYVRGVESASRPTFFIRGNHETRGAYARDLKSRFEFPEGNYYFAQTLGPVRFVVLDCGEDKTDSHPAYSGLNDFAGYRREQAEWLKKELASEEFKKARWHVLVHHMPLYGRREVEGEDNGRNACRKLWEPVLAGAPIDLALCAHTHHLQIIPKGSRFKNPYPVVVGGGSSLRQEPTMTLLQAGETALEVKQFDPEGKEVGALKLGK